MALFLVRATVRPDGYDALRAWLDDPAAPEPGFETVLQAAVRAGHFSGPRLYFTVDARGRSDPRADIERTLGEWIIVGSSLPVHEVAHGFEEDEK